jgi:hypothetical protein
VTKTRILAGGTPTFETAGHPHRQDDGVRPTAREKNPPHGKDRRDHAPMWTPLSLSDYGHGAVSGKVIEYMKILANDKLVVGDSRYSLKKYSGLTMNHPQRGGS